MSYKLGSLFDGSGGFPLAGSMCGIEPVWASEVEPYPIAVTRSRFSGMKHLGSVTDVRGGDIEPVDIITFGSPCQDLSVAGKRAGLKHEANGDEETTRSGLFMEAVRIIKEMRCATNGRYPTFAIWENVPGAFSSNNGEDFRIVLEELIKIAEPSAVMPEVPKSGWPYADCYLGDGWSLAYRVLDAQYWGVPQRRRRIYLVLDLGGERAGEVLFEREGLRGDFAEGGTPWKAVAGDATNRTGADDCEGECVAYSFDSLASNSMKSKNPHSGCRRVEIAKTLDTTDPNPSKNQGGIAIVCIKECLPFDTTQVTSPQNGCNPKWGDPCHPLAAKGHPPTVICKCYDARGNGDGQTVSTLTGDHENRITDYTSVVVEKSPVYCLQGNGIDRADTAGCNGKGWKEDTSYTLNTIDRPAVAFKTYQKVTGPLMANSHPGSYTGQDAFSDMLVAGEEPVAIDRAFFNQGQNAKYDHQYYTDGTVPTLVARGPSAVAVRYIVRRLTPTECARLQGFPDNWGHPDHKEDFTDEEYRFWLNVRNTHAAINGKPQKDYTKYHMLTWYNKLHTDSSEYKMWGNGIALPCALYVMQGIAEAMKNNSKTEG